MHNVICLYEYAYLLCMCMYLYLYTHFTVKINSSVLFCSVHVHLSLCRALESIVFWKRNCDHQEGIGICNCGDNAVDPGSGVSQITNTAGL